MIDLHRNGAVGFIDLSGLRVAAEIAGDLSVVSGGISNVSRRVRIGVPLRMALTVRKAPAPQDG